MPTEKLFGRFPRTLANLKAAMTATAATGVMLCGHGSRNQRAVGEFAALAEALGILSFVLGILLKYG